MFKLKRILNKSHNAPEIETMTVIQDISANKDCIYHLMNGQLCTYSMDDQKTGLLYLALDGVDNYEFGDRTIRCFRITPDMIFEVTASASSVSPGQRFQLVDSDNSGYSGIRILSTTDTESSDGFVYDTSDFSKSKKIYIRFHCKQ